MRVFVVIATKGRARETMRLLDCLQGQTRTPDFTVIVGSETADLENIDHHSLINSGRAIAVVSPRAGSTYQRNFGLEILEQAGYCTPEAGRFFCAFFDDDYRPSNDWLERAAERFRREDIVGLTGRILADGVTRGGLTEDKAKCFLDGTAMPERHYWTGGVDERETDSVYGCNMAFVDTVVRQIHFDENLPLYAWQEDRDYTGMAQKLGRVIHFPECRGVHLGVGNGRTSGVRFGYSQIANPFYLMKKGTMDYRTGISQMSRNIAANVIRGVLKAHPHIDYRGRMRGNGLAFRDLVTLRLDPRNILYLH